MTSPITPEEIIDQKIRDLPSEVIESWNKFIAKSWDGTKSKIGLRYIREELQRATGLEEYEISSMGYLHIEDIYCKFGWNVRYVAPDYTETFEAYYIFTRGSKVV